MYIIHKPQVSEVCRSICAFHQKHPQVHDYPGCTCSVAYTSRDATEEEIAKMERKREPRTYAEILAKNKRNW